MALRGSMKGESKVVSHWHTAGHRAESCTSVRPNSHLENWSTVLLANATICVGVSEYVAAARRLRPDGVVIHRHYLGNEGPLICISDPEGTSTTPVYQTHLYFANPTNGSDLQGHVIRVSMSVSAIQARRFIEFLQPPIGVRR